MNRRGFFKALGLILASPVVAKVAAVLPPPPPRDTIILNAMWGQQLGKSMAADAIAAFTRAQLRETSFAMQILPPQRVG